MHSVYKNGMSRTILVTEDGTRSIKLLVEVHRYQILKRLARAGALIRNLGDTGRLGSPDQFRNEGDGFWAIRANHIRFYGWYEPDGIFVISHVICKRHPRLEDADKNRMIRNQADYRKK